MKRGGDFHPAKPFLVPPIKAAPGNTGRADCRHRDVLVMLGGWAPVLGNVPSFGRNPRGSPDLLAYPVPKACMHALSTGITMFLGVARSASSPKAAQALGCSLTPGLGISFGWVTCMARAASGPGLWTLGFLLLCGACVSVTPPLLAGIFGVCVWIRVLVSPHHSWLGFVVCAVGLGLWLRFATPGWGVGGCLCLWARSACTPPLLAGVCGVGVCA